MCGRYTLYDPVDKLAERFGFSRSPEHISANYNVAPGQTMPVVMRDGGTLKLEMMRWGLIPSWAKDLKIGYKLINARDDSVFDKPMWRTAINKRRVLIPADGFYEWKRDGSKKQPYYIRPNNEGLFAFAGIWEGWKDHKGITWHTYSIITTEPNKEMANIHNRMPVILHQDDESPWLSSEYDNDRGAIEALLRPYEDNGLEIIQVSSDVNVTRNNDHRLIYPINPQ